MRLDRAECLLLALDNTRTARYGLWVQSAGVPTPSLAGEKFVTVSEGR